MNKFSIIALLLLAFSCATASAQKIESRSRSLTIYEEPKAPKEHLPHNWYAKVGVGGLFSAGESLFDYNAAVGYQKQFNKSGWYWGAQIGCATFSKQGVDGNNHYSPKLERSFGPYIGPILGIKKALTSTIQLDGHIGLSYAFETDTDKNAVMGELGLGLWYKRFLIELMYQPSHQESGYNQDCYRDAHRILLNIGIKF